MYRRFVRLVLASLGVSGCLLIVGYSIAASQHDFLGFELREGASINTYLFLSGSMFLHLFLAAVATFSSQPLIAAACTVALILAGALIVFGLRRSASAVLGYVRPALLIMLSLAVLGDILYFDIPVFQLRNVLLSDIKFRTEIEPHRWVEERGRSLWLNMICSRLNGEMVREELAKAGVRCTLSGEEYASKNRIEFLLNTAIASFHVAILSALLFLPSRQRMKKSFCFYVLGAYLVVAVLNILFLPFAYSRILNPTIFRESIVRMDADGEVASEHGFILSESENELVLFHKKERHIWLIPKSRVALVKVERRKDVVTHYFGDLLSRDGDAITAPP